MNGFYLTFLAIGLPLIAVELYGARRHPPGQSGGGEDTISEMWWSVRNRCPALTVAMAAFLIWLFVHFVFEGWRRRPPVDEIPPPPHGGMMPYNFHDLYAKAVVLLRSVPARAAALVAFLTVVSVEVVPMLPIEWQAKAAGYLAAAVTGIGAVVRAVARVTPADPEIVGLLPPPKHYLKLED